MGLVRFQLEADEAKAVGAFLKVVEKQKQVEKGFSDIGKAAKSAERDIGDTGKKGSTALESLKSAAVGAAQGFLSFQTVKTIMGNVIDEIHGARDATLALEKDLTRVISLQGDLNKKPGKVQEEIRSDVLAHSSAYGFEPKDVANLMADVQSRAGQMDPKKRGEFLDTSLRYGSFTGEDPRGFFDAELSVDETFGEKAGGVVPISNRLAKLREKTGMDGAQMNELLADVGPAANAMGYGVDEVFGALSAASHAGGDRTKMTHAISKAIVKIDEAQRTGVLTKSGSLAGDLGQLDTLRQTNPEEFKKLGLEKSVAAISAIGAHKEWLTQGAQDVKDAGPGDYIRRQLNAKLMDPQAFYANEKKTSEQMEANRPAQEHFAELMGKGDRQYDYARMGYRDMLPFGLKWVSTPLSWMNRLSPGDQTHAADVQSGYQKKISEYAAGGRPEMANALTLEAGLVVPYNVPEKDQKYLTELIPAAQRPFVHAPKRLNLLTGDDEAKEYQKFISEGGAIDLNKGYIPYLQAKLSGNQKGANDLWMQQTGGKMPPDQAEAAAATSAAATASSEAAEKLLQAAEKLGQVADRQLNDMQGKGKLDARIPGRGVDGRISDK